MTLILIPINDGNRNQLLRFHIKMAYVGLNCVYCNEKYTSVDNFLGRDPRREPNGDLIDRFCWDTRFLDKIRKWIKKIRVYEQKKGR